MYPMNRKKQFKRACAVMLAALTVCMSGAPSVSALKSVLLGDADEDGSITAYDARTALRYAVDLDSPSAFNVLVCDIDGDGVVKSDDARLILRAAVGLEDLGGKIAGVKLEADTTAPPATEPPTTQPPTTQPPTTQPPTTQPPVNNIDAKAITDDRYLYRWEMENNAELVYQFLSARGWSKNAICATLGNMELESTLSPGLYERGGTGYGLVQWTPWWNYYMPWADRHGYSYKSMEGQLRYLIFTMDPNSGCSIEERLWFNTFGYYGEYYSDFIYSTESVGYLALVFMYCYERPGVPRGSSRVAAAERWYNYFS